MTFKPLFALIAAAAATTSGVASAAIDKGPAIVRYSDLDLASAGGRKALDARIDGAVMKICGTAGIANQIDATSCRAGARQEARELLRAKGVRAL